MKKSQSNYLNMVKAVCDVFESNSSAWGDVGLVKDAFFDVCELVKAVETAAAKQVENAPEGHTAAKEAARTALEDLLFNLGRKLRAFGRIEEDAVVERQSSFSRSALDDLSLNNLLNVSRAIAELCKVRAEQLKPYEIDEVALTNLQLATDKLAKLNAHRDAVVDSRMENTASIVDLLSKTREKLKTLDALVEGFFDDEAFLAVYFSARRVHDVKGGSKKIVEEVVE
ncbi:MAG: hypothetical protein LBU91_06365 [Bacteroidales bacterium]|jgi:hypothetical protein|nr:hypothetical protein [Bacteroidales bacterium]